MSECLLVVIFFSFDMMILGRIGEREAVCAIFFRGGGVSSLLCDDGADDD
jgi:hypothetical protein